jgi:hypothetical protein
VIYSVICFQSSFSKTTVVPDGIISAQLATMIEHSGDDTIVITFPERDFSLRASSNKERNEWFKGVVAIDSYSWLTHSNYRRESHL